MNIGAPVSSRSELYDYLDDFAGSRRSEVDNHDLTKGSGLLKSYILETEQHDGVPTLRSLLAGGDLHVTADQGEVARLDYSKGFFGYAELLTNRHFAIHSFVQNTEADQVIQRAVRDSRSLDSLWLAGNAFHQVLDQIIVPQAPHRSINVRMEFDYRFTSGTKSDREDAEDDDSGEDRLIEEEVTEKRWRVAFIETARRLSANLPRYQLIDQQWRAIRMLRIPAQRQGGFDLWSWGKLTHRSASFREGNGYLRYIAQIYEHATRSIEQTVWLDTEPDRREDTASYRLTGSPAIFSFAEPLPEHVLLNFMHTTFEQGSGPFRLWGNPIPLGGLKFHVYGMDLHLWQRLYMEFTPSHFLFLLPRGTCGNTVHRLMTNIQRYLDPGVTATIGERSYDDFIATAMMNAGLPNE